MKKKYLAIIMFISFTISAVYAEDNSELNVNDLHADQVYYIVKEDIFNFFKKETEQYNTDLKRKVYLNSDEAKYLINKIKGYKELILNHRFSKVLKPKDYYLSEYDIDKGGFYLPLTANFGIGTITAKYPKSILGFCTESISTIKESFLGSEELALFKAFLAVDEEIAIKIEGNVNIKILFEFDVTGSVIREYSFIGTGLNQRYIITQELPVASNIVLKIIDNSTGKLLHSSPF